MPRAVKLKPCPFCGGTPLYFRRTRHGSYASVVCARVSGDHNIVVYGETLEQAREAWNRRAKETR